MRFRATWAGRYVHWLGQPGLDRSHIGGKAAGLNALFQLGVPVPPGCVVDAEALGSALATFRREADVRTGAEASIIGDYLLNAPMEPALVDELQAAASILQADAGRTGELPLAVRSSALDEDGQAFSFAGLHDTVLDVRTPDGLQSAVRQCWASGWSDRAIAYRRKRGGDGAPDGIAVVVQRMVPSDVSFVAFTTDPVTEDPNRLVISATWGLGEALASGSVHPDHIVVDRDCNIIEYEVGAKRTMVIPGSFTDAGVRTVPVPRALQSRPVLTTAQADKIASMARWLAARMGFEADVEGCIAGDDVYVLQARPITSLASPTRVESAPGTRFHTTMSTSAR